MKKHIARLAPKAGMDPQMAVAMNSNEASRIEARRPIRSAREPHTSEPTVVPVRAARGRVAAWAVDRPYSSRIPGSTNPMVAGFITSMARPMASTVRRSQ